MLGEGELLFIAQALVAMNPDSRAAALAVALTQ